ncbi:IS3 family transposase [Corynebacterium diphtheriae]
MTFISENYGVYGVRKMWHALQRQGIDVGREHTARLMRSAGLSSKGQRWGTCHNSST